MRLKIKEPEIEIGEDGFAKHCKLGRAPYGKKLSDLVERIDDPLVIALDGGWGSGKSFFLKCWAGAHKTKNHGSAEVIYFDAFQHDYLDDPLIALTGLIAERFKSEEGLIASVKNAALKIAPSLARIGLAAATAGVSELTTAAGDAALKAGEKEIAEAAEKYWEKENGRRAAMEEFREALKKLTSPEEEGGTPRKIVIIIDELDRCRPDFALALLEVIKHFFSIDHITFVLGVNLKELQNSVRARYGQGVDAERYLGKFIHLHMSLPRTANTRSVNGSHDAAMVYFEKICEEMDLDKHAIERYLLFLDISGIRPSLREAERLAMLAVLSAASTGNLEGASHIVMETALILKLFRPDLYRELLEGKALLVKIASALGLSENDRDRRIKYTYCAWAGFLDEDKWKELMEKEQALGQRLFPNRFRPPCLDLSKEEIASLFHEHLETFTLPAPSSRE